MKVHHHFTVDVEEFFHASALEAWIPRDAWDRQPLRSRELVPQLLDLLGENGSRGTFFVLGWLGQKEGRMVRSISDAGHEVASHGWDHRRVATLSPQAFRGDVQRSRAQLQDLTGQPVQGYRAPSFSILPGLEWALDVLLEEGYRYDSSLFPIRGHPGYGYPMGERDPYLIRRPVGELLEVPPATLRMGPLNLPAAGGAYLRFLPVYVISWALRRAEKRGVPGTLYIHPWELDSKLPAFPGGWRTQARMRLGTKRTSRKLSFLTRRFSFRPIQDTLASFRTESPEVIQ